MIYITEGAQSKIESFINKSVKSKLDTIFSFFKKKYFNVLTESELDELLSFFEGWYYFNDVPTEKTIKKYKPLFEKINKLMVNKPKFIYRGLSFQTKREMEQTVKKLDQGVVENIKTPYTSWSSSKEQASDFLPGGHWVTNKKYGILVTLTESQYEKHILFSILGLIPQEADKKKFLKLIFDRIHSRNIDSLQNKATDLKSLRPSDFFGKSYGAFYAASEDEVILKNFKTNDKILFKIVNKE